ncbi:MAG: BolA/IbaG family iron-sulfur metabolism protein [Nitrosomonadales bacterium]|nr:BolA/IbaG family iron-sulfur metabolism protein [Nitrosomonadales bacterium]
MVTPESIEHSIEQGMNTVYLSVDGDGRHFEAVVVSGEFAGKSRVQRHQRVYQTLGERMREEVHALSIKTYTPQEWESRRKS